MSCRASKMKPSSVSSRPILHVSSFRRTGMDPKSTVKQDFELDLTARRVDCYVVAYQINPWERSHNMHNEREDGWNPILLNTTSYTYDKIQSNHF